MGLATALTKGNTNVKITIGYRNYEDGFRHSSGILRSSEVLSEAETFVKLKRKTENLK